jgi:hypothetical protein
VRRAHIIGPLLLRPLRLLSAQRRRRLSAPKRNSPPGPSVQLRAAPCPPRCLSPAAVRATVVAFSAVLSCLHPGRHPLSAHLLCRVSAEEILLDVLRSPTPHVVVVSSYPHCPATGQGPPTRSMACPTALLHRAKCDADAGEHRLAQRGSPPCMGRLRSNSTRRVAMIECLRRRDTSTPTPALTPRRGAPYSYSPSPSGAPTHATRRGLERRRRHRRRAHAVSRRRRAEDMCWNCAPPRNHRVSASAGPLRCRRTPALAHLPVGIPVSPT